MSHRSSSARSLSNRSLVDMLQLHQQYIAETRRTSKEPLMGLRVSHGDMHVFVEVTQSECDLLIAKGLIEKCDCTDPDCPLLYATPKGNLESILTFLTEDHAPYGTAHEAGKGSHRRSP